jgi:hypothetical protein
MADLDDERLLQDPVAVRGEEKIFFDFIFFV